MKKIEEIGKELMAAELFTPNEAANNVLIVGVLAEIRKDERAAGMKAAPEVKKPEQAWPIPNENTERRQMTPAQINYLEKNRIPYDETWGFDKAFDAIGKHKSAHGR